MKILIISYYYTPAISPRAFRWTSIAEYWAKQGEQVTVICSCDSNLKRNEIVNGVHIHRTGNTIIKTLRKQFINDNSIKNKKLNKQGRSKNRLPLFLKWIYDHTWKKVYWPDFACLWYFSALKKAKYLFKTYKYDILISVSVPFTCNMVGLNLKKSFPQACWIMDVGDPFCVLDTIMINNKNNNKIYKKINYFIEKKIVNYANAISVTNKIFFKKYIDLFPVSAKKIYIIPPLISLNNNDKNKSRIFLSKDKIKFVFIGSLYKKTRNPKFLLKLFSELLQTHLSDRLELHFFGNISDCYNFFKPYTSLLDNKIFLHGLVNHNTAQQIMIEANFLVNIGNSKSYLLPSKLVEYTSTGKPILNLIKNDSDSTVSFLNKYSASLSLLEDMTVLNSNYLQKLIEFIENPPKIKPSILNKMLINFQIEEIASTYKKLFK